MPQFVFTSICDTFKTARLLLTKDGRVPTEDEKKDHDQRLYAALMPSFSGVKDFYKSYEKTMAFLKEQAKNNADAIEKTLKDSKGKPSPVQLKLIKESHALVVKAGQASTRLAADVKRDLMDWRGGWDVVCAAAAFNQKPLQTIMAYRKSIIDLQAKEWNPTAERIEQYVIRVNTWLEAAIKGGANAPTTDAGADLQRLTKAHADTMDAGAKGVRSLMQTVTVDAAKLKKEAKDGLPTEVKNGNVAAIWKAREGKYSQYEAYAKAFSGATKTLTLLQKSVADGAKSASKDTATAWKELKANIDTDLKLLEKAEKECAECIKSAAKVAEYYKKAIKAG